MCRSHRRGSQHDDPNLLQAIQERRGKQQFSMDVQDAGCSELISRMGFPDEARIDYVDDGGASDDFSTALYCGR